MPKDQMKKKAAAKVADADMPKAPTGDDHDHLLDEDTPPPKKEESYYPELEPSPPVHVRVREIPGLSWDTQHGKSAIDEAEARYGKPPEADHLLDEGKEDYHPKLEPSPPVQVRVRTIPKLVRK